MQPTWAPEADAHREKVQAFLAEHRMLSPRRPAEHGRPGFTESDLVAEAFARIQRDSIGETVPGLPEEPRPQGAGASWKADRRRS